MRGLVMRFSRKIDAFTLAEVLITLGIIGVVAAMTIPNLMANIQGSRVRTQFKKAISTLNQAGRMAQAQYDWSFGDIKDTNDTDCLDSSNPEDKMSMCALLNGTLTGKTFLGNLAYQYSAHGYAYEGSSWNDHVGSEAWFILYQLQDGSIIGMNRHPSGCTKNAISNWTYPGNCTGFIDINGKTLPNKEIKCENESDTKAFWESGYKDCSVKLKGGVGDVFPVVFYESTVEPSTNAGRYVLNTSK